MDITAFDAALRIFYLPVIRKQLAENTILLQNIKRDSKKIDASGKYARLTLNKEWSAGYGARAENADLPTEVDASYVNSDVYMRYEYGRIKVTGPVMAASKDNKGAITRALSSEMSSITLAIKNNMNREVFGDGYGALALVATDGGDDSGDLGAGYCKITVDTTKYIKKGMKIDFFTAKSGGSAHNASVVVKNVGSSTEFDLLNADANTVATSDYVFIEDARGVEMMGLLGIIDEDTYRSTLQGVNRSTGQGNNWWRGSVQASGVNADLKLSDMQDAWTKGEQNDGVTKFIITTFSLRDAYADLLIPDRRYVNTMELKGGYKGISFNDAPVVADKDAIAKTMFFVDPSTLTFFVSKEVSWMDDDGHILSRILNKDAFEATLRAYQNLGVDNCVRNVVLRNVQ